MKTTLPRLLHRALFFGLISLASALFVLGLDRVGLFTPLSLKAHDLLFMIKAKTRPNEFQGPIVLVAMDDATFDDPDFALPLTLWHDRFAAVIPAMARAKAKVVAMDFLLPPHLFKEEIPGQSMVWLTTLGQARGLGVPLVTGYIQTTKGKILRPHENYLQIIGKENLGLFNLTSDQDDFTRRHRLYYRTSKGREVQTFPYITTKAYDPDLEPPADTVVIDYRTPAPGFPVYSFSDVYDLAMANDTAKLTEMFQGKIVFIGSTDSRDQDTHSTPLYYLAKNESGKLPGVIIHANIVNTLLSGVYFRELDLWSRLALYLGLALVASGLALLVGGRYGFLAPMATLPLYFGASALAFAHHLIPPLVEGLAVLTVSGLGSFIYRHLTQDREKRRLRKLFSRYLQPQIVTRLLDSNEADFFRGENKRLCILFSDIRDFTHYSEKRPPAEVVSRLNEYFEAMSQEIAAQGGITDKYLGDGILAFFGALDDQDPSLAGARTAMAMLRRLEELNREWQKKGEPSFRIGVGMATGVVMVGNIGSVQKTEFTVIGDAVNLASRLQDKTKTLGVPVLITEDVYDDLGPYLNVEGLEVEEKGLIEIRGRAPACAYSLKAMRGQP